MNIREVELADAEKLFKLMLKVDEESKFMLWSSGERKITLENQLKMIESFFKRTNSTILVAEEKEELVGYLENEFYNEYYLAKIYKK